MAKETVQCSGFSSCSGWTPTNWGDYQAGVSYPIFTAGFNFVDLPQTENKVTIYENNGFKLEFWRQTSNFRSIFASYNDTEIEHYTFSYADVYYLGVLFVIDNDTQLGRIYFCSSINYHENTLYSVRLGTYEPSNNTYLAITGALQPQYQWSSVPAISGKNGILSLPMLDTLSWDGTPITNAERSIFTTLPDAANLRSLYSNVVYGEPYPIVFAGDEHVAIITWTNATTFSIDYKWKYDDVISFATVTYTLAHAQDEVWFAFVSMITGDPEEPEQQVRWARPSFIIRDANTGKYSFGIEQITEAYYPAFYEWHIAGFSADFSVFGDPNEEEGGEGYGDIVEDPIDNPLTPSI